MALSRNIRTLILVCCAVLALPLVVSACSPGTSEPHSSQPGTSGTSGTGEPATAGSASPAAAPAPAPESPAATGPAEAASALPVLSPEQQATLNAELILAAKANDAGRTAELIHAGADVNAKDSLQDSAFLYAGAEGFNEVLQLTLAAGADVASTNRYGGTALIPASEHGHTETVRILIAAGVPVDHVNNLGWTAMQEAVLLNSGGARQQDVVRQLLAAGADPGIRDPQGRTALENAVRLGFTQIAEIIRTESRPAS